MVEQEKTELAATGRSVFGKKVKQLRRGGLTPANIFGRSLSSEAVEVSTVDLKEVLRGQASRNDVVYLMVDNADARPTLIRNVQLHPISDELLHVDFEQISLSERVRVDVPISFIGRSEAVDILGGTLLASLGSITVEALPNDVPTQLELDISVLVTLESSIHVSDLTASLGSEVEIVTDSALVVATVAPPRVEEELPSISDEEDVDAEGSTEESSDSESDGESPDEEDRSQGDNS